MHQEDAIPDFVRQREQLVTYRDVRDLAACERFYGSMGFELDTVDGGDLRLSWGGRVGVLRERIGLPPPPAEPPSVLRVIVHDVDTYWAMAQTIEARVIEPLRDSDDGLRAFTVCDPDGFGVRFATPIQAGLARELTCLLGRSAFDAAEDGRRRVRSASPNGSRDAVATTPVHT